MEFYKAASNLDFDCLAKFYILLLDRTVKLFNLKELSPHIKTRTVKLLSILFLMSFGVCLNAYGQHTDQERALEYKKLDEVFSSAFSVVKVSDSTANYVFAVRVLIDQSVPRLESNDPMFKIFFPDIEPVLLKKIDFHKIAPSPQIKQIIIPFLVMIIGKKAGKPKMISEHEVFRMIEKLFYKAEKAMELQTLIMLPHKIAADLEVYN